MEYSGVPIASVETFALRLASLFYHAKSGCGGFLVTNKMNKNIEIFLSHEKRCEHNNEQNKSSKHSLRCLANAASLGP